MSFGKDMSFENGSLLYDTVPFFYCLGSGENVYYHENSIKDNIYLPANANAKVFNKTLPSW